MRVEQKAGTKGSLRWIQRLVEYDAEHFANRLRDAGALAANATVDLVSPRAGDQWAEYRDGRFLEQVGLGHLTDALRGYWPDNGPQWDALGRTSDGRILLVEAKAHVGELASTCGAEAVSSREQIARALDTTRTHFGADAQSDWMTGYYQYANRLAHLQFLRTHDVDATLVFVYFTDDEEMPSPRNHAGFETAIKGVHGALGFPEGFTIPHVAEIFVGVSDIVGSAKNPERHLPGYDYRARFSERNVVRELEGGTVYAARGPEGFAVITDEGMLAELLDDEDIHTISIRVFSTSTARDSCLRENGWM